jgi:hypothetical protein
MNKDQMKWIAVGLRRSQTDVWRCIQKFLDWVIIIIIIIVIFLQGIGQRPIPVQKFNFWTYESVRTFSRTPWTGDQPDAKPLPTQDNTTQKKRGHTSMPRAGFEPEIPMFERPKTVLALDRAAIWTGPDWVYNEIYAYNNKCSLRSNTKGYGDKTHDSQNSNTTALSDRELYHLQFSLQEASPERAVIAQSM